MKCVRRGPYPNTHPAQAIHLQHQFHKRPASSTRHHSVIPILSRIDINPKRIRQGDGSKQCLPKKVEGHSLIRTERYLHHILLNQIHPSIPVACLPQLGLKDWKGGGASTSFWRMDESLFHIPNLRVIMYHRLLNSPHPICSIGWPSALQFYVVLVHWRRAVYW